MILQIDSITFESIVRFISVRDAKGITSPVSDDHKEAQAEAIYRLTHWLRVNLYNPVQLKFVTHCFKLSILVIWEK